MDSLFGLHVLGWTLQSFFHAGPGHICLGQSALCSNMHKKLCQSGACSMCVLHPPSLPSKPKLAPRLTMLEAINISAH